MKIFLDEKQVTVQELDQKFHEIGELDTIELVYIDDEGNMHFEINAYGVRM